MKKCTLKSGQHNLVKREDLHKVCSLKSESKILKSGSNILKSGQGKIIRREDLCTICTLKQGQGNIVRWEIRTRYPEIRIRHLNISKNVPKNKDQISLSQGNVIWYRGRICTKYVT